MVEIPNGAVAVCDVQLTGLWSLGSADGSIAKINQQLIDDGLTIIRSDVGASGIAFPLTGEFSANLQILNQSGQELDDTDLQAQFADAVVQVGGNPPTAFAVNQVIGGDSGTNSPSGKGNVVTTPSGQAGTPGAGTGVPACGDSNLSFFKYPQEWISCLTSKGLSTIGLLAIGLLVGIVLIVAVERRPTPV